MNLNYKLTNSDFLEFHLYSTSKSELHKKKRFWARITVPIIYSLLAFFLTYKSQEFEIGILFSGIGMAWYLLYPMYSKWRYEKQFKKYVQENYKNRVNKLVEINFNKNSVHTTDFATESKIKGTELKELIETKKHFFIKLTTDTSLVIPKQNIPNLVEFKNKVTDLGANYINELNWEWK